MALVIYWYDFICFAIVAVTIFISLWLIFKKEGLCKSERRSMYEDLLVAQSDGNGFVDAGCARGRGPGYLSSTQLWTSCWPGVNPVWLLVLRMVSVVMLAGFLVWDVRQDSKTFFIYYTEWTFTLVFIYFVLASIVSAHGCWMNFKKRLTENGDRNEFFAMDLEGGKSTSTVTSSMKKTVVTINSQSYCNQRKSEQKAGFFGYLVQIIYQTCAGAVLLTDFVFWFLIAPFLQIEHFKLTLLMGCIHTVNAVFLLLDTSLNNLPFPSFRIAYFMLWSSVYAIFQWVLHSCGFPWWPYPFIELSTPWAPFWYFCLALVHLPCYGLYALVVRVKILIRSRLFPMCTT